MLHNIVHLVTRVTSHFSIKVLNLLIYSSRTSFPTKLRSIRMFPNLLTIPTSLSRRQTHIDLLKFFLSHYCLPQRWDPGYSDSNSPTEVESVYRWWWSISRYLIVTKKRWCKATLIFFPFSILKNFTYSFPVNIKKLLSSLKWRGLIQIIWRSLWKSKKNKRIIITITVRIIISQRSSLCNLH